MKLIVYEEMHIKYYECVYFCLSFPACKSHLFYAASHCQVWPVLLYGFSLHYLINGTTLGGGDGGRGTGGYKMCVFIFSTTIIRNILRRIERDTIINVHGLPVKYPFFLSDFIKIWIFSTVFEKKLKYQPWCGSSLLCWSNFMSLEMTVKHSWYMLY